jgi:putative glutamine amidotransferase
MPSALRKKIGGVDDERDGMEIYVVRKLVERDKPLFGICRGIQVMNVALGGTLIPHVEGHRNPRPDAFAHRIKWERSGTLKRAMNGFERVNTSHHQAVDRVARGFEVVARAPDGVIEAMEMPEARFCCAVQFHPERLVKKAPEYLKFFQAFVRACWPRR